MSLNSFVTRGRRGDRPGPGRAGRACGIEPEAVMNPVLLKPGSDTGSQLIVLGQAVSEIDAAAYWRAAARRACSRRVEPSATWPAGSRP